MKIWYSDIFMNTRGVSVSYKPSQYWVCIILLIISIWLEYLSLMQNYRYQSDFISSKIHVPLSLYLHFVSSIELMIPMVLF